MRLSRDDMAELQTIASETLGMTTIRGKSSKRFRNSPQGTPDTAKTKGVHCEVESEGRWRQISGLTYRNHIRLQLRIRLHNKPKSNNYSESTVVNVADIWRERNVWYQGRSRQQVETEYEPCSNNEWREVSRGHSTKTVANVMGRTEL